MNIRNSLSKPERVVHPTGGEMLTQQHLKDETDINTIVARYYKGGSFGNVDKPKVFGDFSAPAFQDMQNSIADIESNFSSLSSKIRTRFQNSPYQLLRFVDNPDNADEARKLGLLPPLEEIKPESLPLVPDPEANPHKKSLITAWHHYCLDVMVLTDTKSV